MRQMLAYLLIRTIDNDHAWEWNEWNGKSDCLVVTLKN
jgi:hypothetical protein